MKGQIPWDQEYSTPAFDVKVWMSPKLKAFLKDKQDISAVTGVTDFVKLSQAYKAAEGNIYDAIELLIHDKRLSQKAA